MNRSRHRRRPRTLCALLAWCLASTPGVVLAEPAMRAQPEADEGAKDDPSDEAGDEPRDEESPPPESVDAQRQDVRVQVAERHYVEGMVLFNRGSYGEAAVEFEHSYAAIPAARTLHSIGLSHERAGHTIRAIEAYDRYLALPDCSEPDVDRLRCAEQRKEVGRSAEKLRGLVGRLELDVAAGVKLREVRVGGRVVPLEDFPVLLVPGPTEVEIFGLEPEDHRVRIPRIVAGESYVLHVPPFTRVPPPNLEPDPPPKPELPTRDLEAERRRQAILKQVFWAGLGVTLAAGGTTGLVGGLRLREERRFILCEEMCPPPDDPEDGERHIPYPADVERRFRALTHTTNVMIGVTAALGLATVIVGAVAFSRRPGSARRANVQLTGNGFTIRW